MATHTLNLGKLKLPLDAVNKTFAIMGIRRAGKTTTAKVLAEEMCIAQLPWIALDPVGVWWGLRSNTDGSPSKLPVVVFGGKHGDLPLDRTQGRQIARAIIAGNVCAVIDMSGESKTFWRTFLVDFCLELMELEPEQDWHVFIEEAPEFCPQRGMTDLTKRTTEAVERLVRLGGNRGYGATIITQRPARVNKDVLSQCENLFVMRTTGTHDRKALEEWLEAQDRPDFKFKGLGALKSGQAYFWSPQWLEIFEKLDVRPSTTYHPGRTRSAGRQAGKTIELGDVSRFVSDLVVQLAREHATDAEQKSKPHRAVDKVTEIKNRKKTKLTDERINALEVELEHTKSELEAVQQNLEAERATHRATTAQLARVRKVLKPFAEAYAEVAEADGGVDSSAWDPWLTKAGKPTSMRHRMLKVLIEKRRLSRRQLCTLAGASPRGGATRNAISWMSTNQLLRREGNQLVLQDIA